MSQGATPGRKPGKLTAQQRLFALEYLRDRNGTQAAIRAGYSPKAASQQASVLLGYPKVQALLEQKLEAAEQRTEVKLDRVLRELYAVLTVDPLAAFAEDGALKPLSEWPEELRRAVSGMDVEELFAGRRAERELVGSLRKVRFWSKTHAAEQLLRVLGAFNDRLEVLHLSHAELVLLAEQRATGEGEPTVQ